MNIIGLIGFAGSGKTSIAKAMTGWTRLAFADDLKLRAAAALGIDMVQLDADKQRLRPLLVELGKAGRMLDPMRWVKPVMKQIGQVDADVVIDDVRYLNECQAIIARKGRLFYISRPGVGPANDEEGNSIATIFNSWGSLVIPTIYNSTPAEAAAKIMERITA